MGCVDVAGAARQRTEGGENRFSGGRSTGGLAAGVGGGIDRAKARADGRTAFARVAVPQVLPDRRYRRCRVVLSVCLGHGWIISQKKPPNCTPRVDREEKRPATLWRRRMTSSKEEAQIAAQIQELQPQLKELEARQLALQAEADHQSQARLQKSPGATGARLKKLQGIHGNALAELLGAVVNLEAKRES